MRPLVWFRADLRTSDNTALHHAALGATRGVVGLFVLSPDEWRRHDWAASKVEFILRTLRVLSIELQRLNIPLLIRCAHRAEDVPGIVRAAVLEHECDEVHAAREYEIDESRRDERVAAELKPHGVRFRAWHDQTVLPPGDVRTQAGTPFTVFTPFKKRWLTLATERGVTVLPMPRKQQALACPPDPVPDELPDWRSSVPASMWPGGERAAEQRLTEFCRQRIGRYREDRDCPALDGTSALSPYLAIGAISPRRCVRAAAEANRGRLDGGEAGAATWISELVWREFYKHILVSFPRVCMRRAFKLATDRLGWSRDEEHFRAWCQGRTGYPIVDAAMRSLLATGWMHNRLRMVTAMFLTKDLFIDWRWGERHFMRHLIDGDLSQNNGGWQWSASTGTDAAPYFRIFNPASQSERFDPRGAFIRRWVPELKDLHDDDIHDPQRLPPILRARLEYPEPIVDHGAARDRVVQAFKALA